MDISRQSAEWPEETERGPRARTRRLMLETAIRLMQAGLTPSVSDVAEAAGVSRATAYRYFPSQAALVDAVVDDALGPILKWKDPSPDAAERIKSLFRTSLPRLDEFEATFKAALKLSLHQWAQRKSGVPEGEPQFMRGHRVELLRNALEPLRGQLPREELDRLAQALSLIFGIEALVVLKDIWGLESKEYEKVATWAALELVRATMRHKNKEA